MFNSHTAHQNIPSNDVLVLPANLAGQTTDSAELAAGLETENTESLGNDDLLGLVVGRGDTLEDLEALESSGTTGGLVGDHATDSLVENSGGSAEVEGTCIESMIVVKCVGTVSTHHREWGCNG